MVQVSAATAAAAACGILVHFALLVKAFVVVVPCSTKKTAFGLTRQKHRSEEKGNETIRQRGHHQTHSGSAVRLGSTVVTPLVGRRRSSFTTLQRYYRDSDTDDDDDNIRILYRTVAENDPEWFQKFVIELLGEYDEILDPEMIALAKRRPAEHQQVAEAVVVPSDSSPSSEVETTITEKAQNDEVAAESAGSGATTTTTVMEEPVADAMATENRLLLATVQETSEMKETASTTTTTQSQAVLGDQEGKELGEGDGKDNYPVVLEKESPSSVVDSLTSDRESTTIWPIVVDTTEPILNDAPSVTAKENGIVELERAVPPLKSETTIATPPQTEKVTVGLSQQRTTESQSPPSLQTSATAPAKETATLTKSVPPPPPITATTPTTTPTTRNEKRDDRVVLYEDGFTKEWKCVPLSTLIGLGYTEIEITSLQPDALDLIVQDPIRKPRSGIPQRWKTLDNGSAAVRIVAASEWDQEPSQSSTSKTQPNENDVGMKHVAVSDSESKAFSTEPTIPAGATAASRRSTTIPLEPPAANVPDKKQPNNENFSVKRPGIAVQTGASSVTDPRASVKDTATSQARESRSRVGRTGNVNDDDDTIARRSRVGDDSPRSDRRRPPPTSSSPRERRRDDLRREDRQKTVYNVRPSPRQKAKRAEMDDPPPSSAGLWPDMDTFRRLLRNEAELRLKILGDDWTNAVKEEADWRHDLYKNWLWTLHRGVGEPFVESRSDRARRRQRRPPSPSATAPESRASRRVRER